MSVNSFKREVWHPGIEAEYQRALVAGNCVSTRFQGDVVGAKSVTYTLLGDIVVHDGPGDSPISIQDFDTTSGTLPIDQEKYFAFRVKDADAVQTAAPLLGEAQNKGGRGMANKVDLAIVTALEAGALNANDIGSDASPYSFSAAGKSVLRFFLEAGEKLVAAERDEDDFWALIPAQIKTEIIDSGKVVMPTNAGELALRRGYLGDYAGFHLFETNQVKKVADLNATLVGNAGGLVLFGVSSSTAFVSQIDPSSVEAYRDPDSFADVVRAQALYGLKVVSPEGLVRGAWKK